MANNWPMTYSKTIRTWALLGFNYLTTTLILLSLIGDNSYFVSWKLISGSKLYNHQNINWFESIFEWVNLFSYFIWILYQWMELIPKSMNINYVILMFKTSMEKIKISISLGQPNFWSIINFLTEKNNFFSLPY